MTVKSQHDSARFTGDRIQCGPWPDSGAAVPTLRVNEYLSALPALRTHRDEVLPGNVLEWSRIHEPDLVRGRMSKSDLFMISIESDVVRIRFRINGSELALGRSSRSRLPRIRIWRQRRVVQFLQAGGVKGHGGLDRETKPSRGPGWLRFWLRRRLGRPRDRS